MYENDYSSVDSIVFVDIIQNPEYSQFYAWGVQGRLDDENSDISKLIDSLSDDMTDAEILALNEELGLGTDERITKYTGPVYQEASDAHSLNRGHLVIISKNRPVTLIDSMGSNVSDDQIAYRLVKTVQRGGEYYTVWAYPNMNQGERAYYYNLTLNP